MSVVKFGSMKNWRQPSRAAEASPAVGAAYAGPAGHAWATAGSGR
jgi:hypothetical protein